MSRIYLSSTVDDLWEYRRAALDALVRVGHQVIHLEQFSATDRDAVSASLEALGEVFSRHRGDRKISFEVETGEAPHRLRVKVDVSSQIRVRPSPTTPRIGTAALCSGAPA